MNAEYSCVVSLLEDKKFMFSGKHSQHSKQVYVFPDALVYWINLFSCPTGPSFITVSMFVRSLVYTSFGNCKSVQCL